MTVVLVTLSDADTDTLTDAVIVRSPSPVPDASASSNSAAREIDPAFRNQPHGGHSKQVHMAQIGERLPGRLPFGDRDAHRIASYTDTSSFEEEEAFEEENPSEHPPLRQPPPSGRAVELRKYQLTAIDQLHASVRKGARSPLLVLPTGAGKTVIACEIMRDYSSCDLRSLFLAPRRELVVQTSRQLTRAGISHG